MSHILIILFKNIFISYFVLIKIVKTHEFDPIGCLADRGKAFSTINSMKDVHKPHK